MDQRRTHRRLGVFVATGVVAAGLGAFPAFTFADGNGSGNGHGNGHQNGNGTRPRERQRPRRRQRQRHRSRPRRDLPHPSGQPGQRAHDHGRRASGRCSHGQPRRPVGPVRATTTTECPSTSNRPQRWPSMPTVTVSYTPTFDPTLCSVDDRTDGLRTVAVVRGDLGPQLTHHDQRGITVDLQQRSDGRRGRGHTSSLSAISRTCLRTHRSPHRPTASAPTPSTSAANARRVPSREAVECLVHHREALGPR